MEGTIGEIRMFSGSFPPANWARCDGSQLKVLEHQALYTIIGNMFGGTATTFNLPDLRDKFPVGTGTNFMFGATGGANMVEIKANNLPAHNHSFEFKPSSLTANAVTKIYMANQAADGTLDGAGKLLSSAFGGGDNFVNDGSTRIALSPKTAETTVNVTMTPQSGFTNTIGAGEKLNITPPYQVVNFIICIKGDYPSRDRRRILVPGLNFEIRSFRLLTQDIFIGNSSSKKKIVRVNNPFYNTGFRIQPTIQIRNTEKYADVFATSMMGHFDAEYFEVAIIRIDGDSWAQELFMTVHFNFYDEQTV
ncbi:MAG: tail fiber protein [Bacteroidetes bacterium]|nr:tail fiber protein [Bacteroidota bacterium]